LTDLDYADLLTTHIESGAPLTVATNERVYQVDFGVLNVGDENKITSFTEKPTLGYTVSMGVYAISKSHLERYTPGLPYGFDEIMLDLIKREEYPASYAFNGFWLDIGRPEDYDRANEEFAILAPRLLPGAR
jgi:NDP-sugar pyrophosphorylase family protein